MPALKLAKHDHRRAPHDRIHRKGDIKRDAVFNQKERLREFGGAD
jgi:hypothetical protein